jgi:hypothetical protein
MSIELEKDAIRQPTRLNSRDIRVPANASIFSSNIFSTFYLYSLILEEVFLFKIGRYLCSYIKDKISEWENHTFGVYSEKPVLFFFRTLLEESRTINDSIDKDSIIIMYILKRKVAININNRAVENLRLLVKDFFENARIKIYAYIIAVFSLKFLGHIEYHTLKDILRREKNK